MLAEGAAARKPFKILYTGTIYEGGYHDPEPLFKAIAGRKWSRQIRLTFIGQSAGSRLLRSLRDRYCLGDVVQLPTEKHSRADCVRLQREADLLLHLGWTNRAMDGVLSAKIFEYLAA